MTTTTAPGPMTTLTGIPASDGIAIGRLHILDRADHGPLAAPGPHTGPSPAPAEAPGHTTGEEEVCFTAALTAATTETRTIRDQTMARLGPLKAEIFDAHLSILRDPELKDAVLERIRDGMTACQAIGEACEEFVALLAEAGDELFAARSDDIRDIAARLIRHCTGAGADPLDAITAPVVLAATDLRPSETSRLDPTLVLGIMTAEGSRTSHSSILARSLGIPAVAGLGDALAACTPGTTVIIDGTAGTVMINPDTAALDEGRARAESRRTEQDRIRVFQNREGRTADGTRIEVAANIGGPGDLPAALANGAEGVGLFRTEFLYMDRPTLPTEDEQYQIYRQVLEAMEDCPVIIRTLDIGGDKDVPCLPMDKEENPFLGVRALRLCLERPELFRTQLRALLRAGVHGDLRIMFPMVATLEELRQAKALLAAEGAGLQARGIPHAPSPKVGIMIEIPAAALNARNLAREADFFSIGTNDLIQYTMAADRMNQRLGHLYQPLHPSVLRLIHLSAEAAKEAGIPLGMCGEMAADPRALPLLVGLGLDELSMGASSIGSTKEGLTRIDRSAARNLALAALDCGTSQEVEALVAAFAANPVRPASPTTIIPHK